ncbi:hypothetical protein D3C87_1850990 [compost metagenome]
MIIYRKAHIFITGKFHKIHQVVGAYTETISLIGLRYKQQWIRHSAPEVTGIQGDAGLPKRCQEKCFSQIGIQSLIRYRLGTIALIKTQRGLH